MPPDASASYLSARLASGIAVFDVRIRLRDVVRVELHRSVEAEPVAEGQTIDLVHHLELEAAGLVSVAVPQRNDAALLLRIKKDQRAIAANAAAVADDVVPGIVVAAPAIAVPGGAKPLQELAHSPALGRSDDVGRMDGIEHLAVEHIGHFAHLRFHPQRHVLDVRVDARSGWHLVISVDN